MAGPRGPPRGADRQRRRDAGAAADGPCLAVPRPIGAAVDRERAARGPSRAGGPGRQKATHRPAAALEMADARPGGQIQELWAAAAVFRRAGVLRLVHVLGRRDAWGRGTRIRHRASVRSPVDAHRNRRPPVERPGHFGKEDRHHGGDREGEEIRRTGAREVHLWGCRDCRVCRNRRDSPDHGGDQKPPRDRAGSGPGPRGHRSGGRGVDSRFGDTIAADAVVSES